MSVLICVNAASLSEPSSPDHTGDVAAGVPAGGQVKVFDVVRLRQSRVSEYPGVNAENAWQRRRNVRILVRESGGDMSRMGCRRSAHIASVPFVIV